MREITTHKVNEANGSLMLQATDGPGPGGANHQYTVNWEDRNGLAHAVGFQFQDGAIKETGVNGITHEVLLAIISDRLEAFQRGPYACAENAAALACIGAAQFHLASRTKRRTDEGSEGTMALDKAAVRSEN